MRRETILSGVTAGLATCLIAGASLAGGGGSDGYVSDAPIPWSKTATDDGRQILTLIDHAIRRLNLQTAPVRAAEADLAAVADISAETANGAEGSEVVEAAVQVDSDAPVQDPRAPLVVPYSALIYWNDGSTWVYAVQGDCVEGTPCSFLREKVAVIAVEGDEVLLAAGPPPETLVVTVGAAELYGAETGTGH